MNSRLAYNSSQSHGTIYTSKYVKNAVQFILTFNSLDVSVVLVACRRINVRAHTNGIAEM